MPLHLSKVAVGCASVELLIERTAARTSDGVAEITTRYRPTRHGEIDGGSLYWIIKHRLVARQTILGFHEIDDARRWAIRLDPNVVLVRPRVKRVHQGWRYLKDEDRPPDLIDGAGDVMLPPRLAAALDALALI